MACRSFHITDISENVSSVLYSLGFCYHYAQSSHPFLVLVPINVLSLSLLRRGRDRYVSEEYDLDLTYITDRIIAMSLPATGVESAYRNSLKDVARLLQSKHQDNYMVCMCAIYTF